MVEDRGSRIEHDVRQGGQVISVVCIYLFQRSRWSGRALTRWRRAGRTARPTITSRPALWCTSLQRPAKTSPTDVAADSCRQALAGAEQNHSRRRRQILARALREGGEERRSSERCGLRPLRRARPQRSRPSPVRKRGATYPFGRYSSGIAAALPSRSDETCGDMISTPASLKRSWMAWWSHERARHHPLPRLRVARSGPPASWRWGRFDRRPSPDRRWISRCLSSTPTETPCPARGSSGGPPPAAARGRRRPAGRAGLPASRRRAGPSATRQGGTRRAPNSPRAGGRRSNSSSTPRRRPRLRSEAAQRPRASPRFLSMLAMRNTASATKACGPHCSLFTEVRCFLPAPD